MSSQASIFQTYCIDSCVFLDFWLVSDPYSQDVFEGAWKHIEELIKQGRIISSSEIFDELKKTRDKKFNSWLSQNTKMFYPVDGPQIATLTQIVNKYPDLTKDGKNTGDAALVALAKSHSSVVLTSEKRAINPSLIQPKIPNLCKEFDVECVNVVEFFRKENIKFATADQLKK